MSDHRTENSRTGRIEGFHGIGQRSTRCLTPPLSHRVGLQFPDSQLHSPWRREQPSPPTNLYPGPRDGRSRRGRTQRKTTTERRTWVDTFLQKSRHPKGKLRHLSGSLLSTRLPLRQNLLLRPVSRTPQTQNFLHPSESTQSLVFTHDVSSTQKIKTRRQLYKPFTVQLSRDRRTSFPT